MLRKSIKYTDYNGNAREEDFYFDISEVELTRMNFTTEGGLEPLLQRIIATQDLPRLWDYFEKIVQMAYGVRSLDGKYFTKDETELKKFMSCPAYNNLIMELVSSADAAAAFVNGIIPQTAGTAGKVLPGKSPIAGVVGPQ